jgi:hypothetical protein
MFKLCKYFVARVLVEAGKELIIQGIDIAGSGSLRVDFECRDGVGFQALCWVLFLLAALPGAIGAAIVWGAV